MHKVMMAVLVAVTVMAAPAMASEPSQKTRAQCAAEVDKEFFPVAPGAGGGGTYGGRVNLCQESGDRQTHPEGSHAAQCKAVHAERKRRINQCCVQFGCKQK